MKDKIEWQYTFNNGLWFKEQLDQLLDLDEGQKIKELQLNESDVKEMGECPYIFIPDSTKVMIGLPELGVKIVEKNDDATYQKKISLEQVFIESYLSEMPYGATLVTLVSSSVLTKQNNAKWFAQIAQKFAIRLAIEMPNTLLRDDSLDTTLLVIDNQKKSKPWLDHTTFMGRVTRLGVNARGHLQYKKEIDAMGRLIPFKKSSQTLDEDFTPVIAHYRQHLKSQDVSEQNAYGIATSELHGRIDFKYNHPEKFKNLDIIRENDAVLLSELATIVKSRSEKLTQPLTKVDYLELADVNAELFEITRETPMQVFQLPARGIYEVQKGDILLAVSGNALGTERNSVAIVQDKHHGAICSNGFRIIRDTKIDPLYLLYFFSTKYFFNQLLYAKSGGVVPRINDNELSDILIPLPSEAKIKEISQQMQAYFDLRAESVKKLQEIDFDLGYKALSDRQNETEINREELPF